ncbi:MAG TPA: HDOD domain-containing protein, partial [Candidatus Hydrogenedentes bacterium]|nr:HDOD domain-containing protein [Candidatus Hydrogenedentota bacterium]
PGQVNDIHLASALLGIDGICEIVVSARIGGAVHDSAHFDLTAFSASSQFCATAAYGVAAVCNPSLNPCARTAGFLHEIGRLALAENWPEHYPATNGQLTGQALIEAEEKTFGIAHPEAGYIIAREWGLPAEITETLRFHHAPQSASEDKQLVAIVALAAYMAEIQQGRGTEKGDPFDACKELLDALGLGKAAVAQIFSETATAVTARST